MKTRIILIHVLFWIAVPLIMITLAWAYRYSLHLELQAPAYSFMDIFHRYTYANLQEMTVGAAGFYLSEFILLKNKKFYWFSILLPVPFIALFFFKRFENAFSILFSFWIITSYVYMVIFSGLGVLSAVVKKMLGLKNKNLSVQLELLKSKTNPHFLFNTINNIDALITRDPEQASSYLNKLSGILRFMLYESTTDRIPLAQEINYIEEYINLEKIRSIHPDFVTLHVQGHVNGQQVAPMTFIPVLENAFKHLSSKTTTGAISLNMNVSEHQIVFSCKNMHNNSDASNGGLGTGLMKKRLELLYGKRSHMEVKKDDTYYEVIIKLDLDAH